jgi:uncharacterized membrane protein
MREHGAVVQAAEQGAATVGESRWGAAAAVLAIAALQVTLPDWITPGPRWAVAALEVMLLVAVLTTNPSRITRESRDARALSLVLIAVMAAANALSLSRLIRVLFAGGPTSGRDVVVAAAGIWLTNVVLFGLVYWEGDRGGPHARSGGRNGDPDLLFPQLALGGVVAAGWAPTFVDYLYVSFTNSTAFSPTDTMPLSRRAKMAMLVQALLSFVTVGLVVARAVNILA